MRNHGSASFVGFGLQCELRHLVNEGQGLLSLLSPVFLNGLESVNRKTEFCGGCDHSGNIINGLRNPEFPFFSMSH